MFSQFVKKYNSFCYNQLTTMLMAERAIETAKWILKHDYYFFWFIYNRNCHQCWTGWVNWPITTKISSAIVIKCKGNLILLFHYNKWGKKLRQSMRSKCMKQNLTPIAYVAKGINGRFSKKKVIPMTDTTEVEKSPFRHESQLGNFEPKSLSQPSSLHRIIIKGEIEE